ncbi:hypothetical protein L1887_02251 [Cichorium endivia]|nr:hypothetical protein L1887_02251 [Cichorium endivia]
MEAIKWFHISIRLFIVFNVMVLSHDRERGRVSLSTKKLESTPGDMIHNPKLVFEKTGNVKMTTFPHHLFSQNCLVSSS